MMTREFYVHPTADVSETAQLGPETKIWNQAQVRERARLGRGCIVGKGSYIDHAVEVGDNVKIQNGVFVYHGATVESGVFLGPGVMLLNDRYPRAINPDGTVKRDSDWTVSKTLVRYGASIGGGAILVPGVTVGRFALVAAGALVTRDVKDHSLVAGAPARHVRWVCECGLPLQGSEGTWRCEPCGTLFRVSENGLARSQT